MKRKRKNAPARTVTPRASMLVLRGLQNDKIETGERLVVQAFALGYATEDHFDVLATMQGILLLAGCTSEARLPARDYAHDVLGPVLASIRARYLRTGKFGCTADELKVLRGFVSMYRDFWLRQPTELYEAALIALNEHQAREAGEDTK